MGRVRLAASAGNRKEESGDRDSSHDTARLASSTVPIFTRSLNGCQDEGKEDES